MPKTSSSIRASHPEHTVGPAQDISPHDYPPTKPWSRKTPCRLEKPGHSCFPQLSKVRKRQRVLICVHLALTADLSPSRRSPQHWKEGKGLSSRYFLCWKAPHLPAVLFPQQNSLRLKCFPEQRKWTASSGSHQEGTQLCQRSHPVPRPPILGIHFSPHRDVHSLPTHKSLMHWPCARRKPWTGHCMEVDYAMKGTLGQMMKNLGCR